MYDYHQQTKAMREINSGSAPTIETSQFSLSEVEDESRVISVGGVIFESSEGLLLSADGAGVDPEGAAGTGAGVLPGLTVEGIPSSLVGEAVFDGSVGGSVTAVAHWASSSFVKVV
jgi:hypothetical protein